MIDILNKLEIVTRNTFVRENLNWQKPLHQSDTI